MALQVKIKVKEEEKEIELSALLRLKEAAKDNLSLRNISQYLSSKVSKFEYDSPREVVGNKVFDYEGEFGEGFLDLLGEEINSVNEDKVFFGKENAKDLEVAKYIYENRFLLEQIFKISYGREKIKDAYRGYNNDCSANFIANLKEIINSHLFDNDIDRFLYNVYCDGIIFPFVTEIKNKLGTDILGSGNKDMLDIFASEENALSNFLDVYSLDIEELKNFFSAFTSLEMATDIIRNNNVNYNFDDISENDILDEACSIFIPNITNNLKVFCQDYRKFRLNIESGDSSDSVSDKSSDSDEPSDRVSLLKQGSTKGTCEKLCDFIKSFIR